MNTINETQSQRPVGQGDYVVKQGDCMSSIAYEHGFFWETLWNHSGNALLRQERKTPNVLLPGDKVCIPAREVKVEAGATENRHRFRVNGVPAKFRLRLLAGDQPRANVSYRLDIDGSPLIEGTTDSEGWLEETVRPTATQGRLLLGEGEEELRLMFRHIDPLNTISGIKGRLKNLGFYSDPVDDMNDEPMRSAVKAFQTKHGLVVDGIAGPKTQGKLREVYGC